MEIQKSHPDPELHKTEKNGYLQPRSVVEEAAPFITIDEDGFLNESHLPCNYKSPRRLPKP